MLACSYWSLLALALVPGMQCFQTSDERLICEDLQVIDDVQVTLQDLDRRKQARQQRLAALRAELQTAEAAQIDEIRSELEQLSEQSRLERAVRARLQLLRDEVLYGPAAVP